SQDSLKGPGDLVGIGVRETDSLFAEGPASSQLGHRRVSEAPPVDRLLLPEPRPPGLRSNVPFCLHARFFDSSGGLALLDQLLVGDDAQHAVLLGLATATALECRV